MCPQSYIVIIHFHDVKELLRVNVLHLIAKNINLIYIIRILNVPDISLETLSIYLFKKKQLLNDPSTPRTISAAHHNIMIGQCWELRSQ